MSMDQQELLSEDSKKAGLYLIELMRSALNGNQAAEIPENLSWENVYKLAEYHHVEALSSYGLKGLKNLPPQELMSKWNTAKTSTLFKLLHFDTEREQIFAEMEKQGLSYLPLKGILLAGDYPNPGMRSMSDNDILYGFVEKSECGRYHLSGENEKEQEKNIKKAQECLVEIMKSRGFAVGHLTGNHDTFYKKPFYNFEMHRELLSATSSHRAYYKNVWEKVIPNENSKYGFHMSLEDEYIFMLVHMEKHFTNGGCGIRHLNDVFVFLNKRGEKMNQIYLQEEFGKLGMIDFEQEIRTLAMALYKENRLLTEKEEGLLYFFLGCGIYGRTDVRVSNKIQTLKKEKETSVLLPRLRYIKERVWIDKQRIKDYYPFFYKHMWLRPLLPFYRILKGIVIHPGKLWYEWKSIWEKLKK